MKKLLKFNNLIAITTASLIIGCGGGSSSTETTEGTTAATTGTSIAGPAPMAIVIEGTTLATTSSTGTLTPASLESTSIISARDIGTNIGGSTVNPAQNISNNPSMGTAHNTIERLGFKINNVNPILISYNEQVVGTPEMGDGSADIGDPTHLDGVFLSVSPDNGNTWTKYTVSNTSALTSTSVTWGTKDVAGEIVPNVIAYPGHAQTPTMAVNDDKIIIAWNDKYCPNSTLFENDYFTVNGEQGFIDYEGLVSPNGKTMYQVPFSCVWTKRGTISKTDATIEWKEAQQLTTGTRDSNHIWIEGSDVGFAVVWQEDKEGLRPGDAEGPGEGWSGATTDHGSDIWYSSLENSKFDTVANLNYPIRLTDNEKCTIGDEKQYCQDLCTDYGYQTLIANGDSAKETKRCNSPYKDNLSTFTTTLDGDTGASRPAVKILKTDKDEHVVVVGYEETKGLSQSSAGVPDKIITNIADEGKAIFFESFLFSEAANITLSGDTKITDYPVPMISAGKIVSEKYPQEGNSSNMIYEDARRLVIGTQVDSTMPSNEKINFAFMYKQSYETQGSSSDMFVKVVKNGFTIDHFENANNISSQAKPAAPISDPAAYTVNWTSANLKDTTYSSPDENTFSPRIFLRGDNIYVGYEYTPNENLVDEAGETTMPSNFHTHIYTNGAWQGPKNITQVINPNQTTVDARFFGTPQAGEGEAYDPNVLFVTWGNIDYDATFDERREADLFYTRSTDNGATWDATSYLANQAASVIEEKEVESLAAADGKSFYNVWIQEEDGEGVDANYKLDSYFGRVDYTSTGE